MIDKTQMVTREKALTGRDEPFPVAEKHSVLDAPLTGPWPDGYQVLYVAMGCFWGAERIYWRMDGVYSTSVGYMGGWTRNPSYPEVCTSLTAHTETVQVVYDPSRVSLDALFAAFWENHDPTTLNRQGADIGTQYRSAIFATTPEQLAAALESREKYQASLTANGYGTITTQIVLAAAAGDGEFYYAEDYHQQYLFKNPEGYCNHGFCQVAYA